MKKLTLLLTFVLLATAAWAGNDVRALIQRAKPAVVQLGVFDQAGRLLYTGTAFFISADGYALTNRHVITGAASIEAKDYQNHVYHLKRIAAVSQEVDVALLQFDAENVPYLILGSTTNTVEGERVLIIGNPEGLTFTVSDGLISSFRDNRSIIQISAPISHGSSGSPVLDVESGQVLGIVQSMYEEGQNLGFAISSEAIQTAIAKAESVPPPVAHVTPAPHVIAPPTPSSTENWLTTAFNRGLNEWKAGNYGAAERSFAEVILIFGANAGDQSMRENILARAHALCGDAEYHLRQYHIAISEYTEAIGICPGSDFSYKGRAAAYDAIGKSHEAEQDRKKAEELRKK